MTTTDKTEAAIIELFQHNPAATFHPSLFTIGADHSFRLGMSGAIRRMKKTGLLEIAYKNIEGRPVYQASEVLKSMLAAGKH